MISLGTSNRPTIGTLSPAALSSNHSSKTERVQQALSLFKQGAVEVLSANPFRSSADQVSKPEPSQRLHHIYSLQKA